MKVYLDDEREAPDGWIRTKTVTETLDLLETGQVTHLSLDHDLGDDSSIGTGYTVLIWLERQVQEGKLRAPESMQVHSMNPVGRHRMEAAIQAIRRAEER